MIGIMKAAFKMITSIWSFKNYFEVYYTNT